MEVQIGIPRKSLLINTDEKVGEKSPAEKSVEVKTEAEKKEVPAKKRK